MIRGKIKTRQKVEKTIQASIHNRFDIEVVDAATGKVRQRAKAENVILNKMWPYLLQDYDVVSRPYSWFRYISFGQGSGTPSVSDTDLFSKIGDADATDYATNSSWEERWYSTTKMCQLNETKYVGYTFTEVGIRSYYNDLVTHAMLTDMNGNPVSIVKTDTDILNIYATVFCHWPSEFSDGVLMYDMTLPKLLTSSYPYGSAELSRERYGRGTSWSYSPKDFFISKSLSISDSNSASKKVSLKMSRLANTEGNVGGYHSILSLGFLFLLEGDWYGDPGVTGEAVGTGNGSTKKFSTAFPINPDYPVSVKVNNSVVNATVIPKLPPDQYQNLSAFFKPLDEFGNYDPRKRLTHTTSGNYLYSRELPAGGVYYWENPFKGYFPITSIDGFYVYRKESVTDYVYTYYSNDFVDWTLITGSGTLPVEAQTAKYFKCETGSQKTYLQFKGASSSNIIFEEAPAEGSVITVDYTPDCIAKDENHVFDFEVTIQLSPYTGEEG